MEQIDKYRKHVLWHGGDVTKKEGYLVPWKHARRSKEDGGLGIINLRNQNTTLPYKFLHKLYNRLNMSWVQLTWEKLYSFGKTHMKESLWDLSGGGISCLSALASSRWLLTKLIVVYQLPSGMTTGIWEL
jgi:hypothetical protein